MNYWQIPGPDELMLGMADVEKFTGLTRRKINALIKDKRFPGPVQKSRRGSKWRGDHIAAWCNIQHDLGVDDVPENPDDDEGD